MDGTMTPATFARAILAVRPETPQHLAIAIAVNSLGYGRAYDVPAEIIATRLLSRGSACASEAILIPRDGEYVAKEAVGLNRRYAKRLMAQAAKLRALAETYPERKYGAE